jgi:hypothetical protein
VVVDDQNFLHTDSGSASQRVTLPVARRWVAAQEQRLARKARPARASIQEWAFAV